MTATKLAADQCSRHCITEHPIIDDLTLGRVWPRAPRDDHDAGGGIHIDVLAVNPHRHERAPPVMPGPPQVAIPRRVGFHAERLPDALGQIRREWSPQTI